MTAAIFTFIFIAALALTTLAKLWLARRHLAHIATNRAAVPDAFHEKVQLTDHQKAADYTSAKTRFDMLGALFDAALLLAFTLGGGIQFIADRCNGWFSSPIAQACSLQAVYGVPQPARHRHRDWRLRTSNAQRFPAEAVRARDLREIRPSGKACSLIP